MRSAGRPLYCVVVSEQTRETDADFLLRVLDAAPAAVLVLNADLTIRWGNTTASNLFGFSLESALGRSVMDFVDPDWNPVAFDSVVSALGGRGMRQPMLFRAISIDGTKTIVEVTANVQFDDHVVNGMVVYARTWDERWHLDEVLEAMASGEPAERSLQLLVQVAGAETIRAPAALLFDPVGGRVAGTVAADGLFADLSGPHLGCDAELVELWAPLLAAADGNVYNVSDLPARLRLPAEASGFKTLWVWPTGHNNDKGRSAWAVAWRDEEHLDLDESRRMMMARLATLAGLIVDRAHAEAATAYAAGHDSLTGLLNRATFHEQLEELILESFDDSAPGEETGVGVVYFDLDDFKPVNDDLGHGAGDRVLSEIGARLRQVAPADAPLARLGGDEFVFACRVGTLDELAEIAEDMTARISEPVALRVGESIRVTASAGVSFARHAELSATTSMRMVDAADTAMYASKRSGGGVRAAAG